MTSQYLSLPIHPESNIQQKFIESRIVPIIGEINDSTHARVLDSINYLDYCSQVDPIYLHINSGGGSVYDAFGIVDIIRNAKSPIYTVCTGIAMSAAVSLLVCGKKGERRIGKYSTIMLHQVSTGSWGALYELKNDIAECQRLQDIYIDILAENTKKGRKAIKKIIDENKDVFLTPAQTIQLGIADKIF